MGNGSESILMGPKAIAAELTPFRRPYRQTCGLVTPAAREEAQPQGPKVRNDHDRELAEAVRRALAALNDPRLRCVSWNVGEGRVWLSGRVATYYAKQLAIHAVMSVASVKQVFDDVIVD